MSSCADYSTHLSVPSRLLYQAKRDFHCHTNFRRRDCSTIRARTPAAVYTPPQVRKGYGVPDTFQGVPLDGNGYKIGVIELGGAFSASDYALAMTKYQIANYLPVQNRGNQQSDPGGADVEVMLDSCVIGGTLPRVQILNYFEPNATGGMGAGLTAALNDKVDAVSISWGAGEDQWPLTELQSVARLIQQLALAGIPVFCASGDGGSRDGESRPTGDFPCTAPFAIAVGGTTLVLAGGKWFSESAWVNGGGGVSSIFPIQPWQKALLPNQTMRCEPDLAGPADPETGWGIVTGGSLQSVGGTSAAAPMWAALYVLLKQAMQTAGLPVSGNWFAPLIYSHSTAFRDIVTGSDGDYKAGPGYDLTTGLGTPSPALWNVSPDGPPVVPPPPAPPTPAGGLPLSATQPPVDAVFKSYLAKSSHSPIFSMLLKHVQGDVDTALQAAYQKAGQ